MSPQDKVERVLKDIHVFFSKCESYQGKPDKVIVDRREFLELLDRLNKGIFEMMSAYEHTRESRARAELAFENKGKEMIADAEQKAEDVYAASVIYTAQMLGDVQRLIDKANDSINDVFVQFKRELRGKKEVVRSNELELESQLNDLADSKTYREMLSEVRREQRRQHRLEDLHQMQFEAEHPAAKGRIYTPAVNADVKVNEEYFEKQGISAENAKAGYVPAPAPLTNEKPEVKVNLESEYFKRKAAQEKEELERIAKASENGDKASAEEGAEVDVNAAEVEIAESVETEVVVAEVEEEMSPEQKIDEEILKELVEWEDAMERAEQAQKVPKKRGASFRLERKTKNQQKEIFNEVKERDRELMTRKENAVPGWKSRMRSLVNEILPKDIYEK